MSTTNAHYSIKRHALSGKKEVVTSCLCGAELRIPLQEAGRTEQCPTCGAAFVVPGVAERDADTREREAQQQAKAKRDAEEARKRQAEALRAEAMDRAQDAKMAEMRERAKILNEEYAVERLRIPMTRGIGLAGIILIGIGCSFILIAFASGDPRFGAIAALIIPGFILLGIGRLGDEINRRALAIEDAIREQRRSS